MFSLKFFGGFKSQFLGFKDTSEFAPVKVSKQTEHLFDDLARSVKSFEKTDYPKNLWLACFNSVKSVALPLVLISFASAFTMLFIVIVTKLLLDGGISRNMSVFLTFAFLILTFSRNTANYLSDIKRFEIMRMLQVYLMTLVNRKILNVEPKMAQSTGNLKTIISTDVEAVEDFVSAAIGTFTQAIASMLILCPYIWTSLGTVGLVGLAVTFFQLPLSLCFAWCIERFQLKTQAEQDSLATLIGEWVKNVRLVRYLGWQPKLNKEIAQNVRRYTIISAMKHFVMVVTYGMVSVWWFVTILAMLISAKYLSVEIISGDFFSSVWALSYLSSHIMHAQWPFIMFGSALAGKRRLEELFAKPELLSDLKRCNVQIPSGDAPRKIHFTDVSVKLMEKETLKGINLTIDLNSRVAIVGDVGSGKTLLLDLLVGELAPTEGTVRVEFDSGVIADLWCEEVYYKTRTYFAYSPQRPYLSNASLRDNIDISGARDQTFVEECVQLAHLEEDLKLFPKGLNEEVGETGINLSGGQKQRVSMARAFASRRPIFILDDPLSAVDRKTEILLMKSIIERAKGLVLVSHRLDELKVCDRVLVMRKGEIIEDGTPGFLIQDLGSNFSKFIEAHRADTVEPK